MKTLKSKKALQRGLRILSLTETDTGVEGIIQLLNDEGKYQNYKVLYDMRDEFEVLVVIDSNKDCVLFESTEDQEHSNIGLFLISKLYGHLPIHVNRAKQEVDRLKREAVRKVNRLAKIEAEKVERALRLKANREAKLAQKAHTT